MTRRLVLISGATAMLTVVAACGLPNDDNFESIDRSQDGFALWETSTTSTTMGPTTTIDVTTSSTIGLTTTTIAQTEPVTIYFPTGQQLTSIPLPLPLNPALPQVMAYMLDGPPEELAGGVRLILPKDPDLTPTVTKAAGVVTVDFPEGLFEKFQEMDSKDQRLVFGQIVLTLCGRPGVGQVKFTLAGAPMLVFRGDGTSPVPGEPVSEDDYSRLKDSAQPIETTTTTTTTTTTSTTVVVVDPGTTTAVEG